MSEKPASKPAHADWITFLGEDRIWGGQVYEFECSNCHEKMTVSTGQDFNPKCRCGLVWEAELRIVGAIKKD